MQPCPIFEWSRRAPNRRAILFDHDALTYAQLNDRVSALAQTNTPFIAHTNLDTVCAFFAAWRAQHAACPISPRLPPTAADRLRARLKMPPFGVGTILATSGSTGEPKLVCHRTHHHLISAKTLIPWLNLEENDCYLASLPFFHVGGIALMVRTFVAGAALLFSKNLLDPRITHLSLVPTQLHRLLKTNPKNFHPKCLLLGGAPIPSSLSHIPFHTSYGMTETASLIALDGTVAPHMEVKLARDGEILVRGASLFDGYLDAPSPLVDGWFPTKDLGAWSADGKLTLLGRKDRLFISGGENIQPEEIEACIHSLFALEQARIIPEPDEEFGMVPTLHIYDPAPPPLADIAQALSSHLPRFKIPKKLIRHTQPFPDKSLYVYS
jgi:O-succinylbenzoic acid--CoA ligase